MAYSSPGYEIVIIGSLICTCSIDGTDINELLVQIFSVSFTTTKSIISKLPVIPNIGSFLIRCSRTSKSIFGSNNFFSTILRDIISFRA